MVVKYFLFLQGTRTTLQPVAVGANGEIGYIAIQEPPIAGTLINSVVIDSVQIPTWLKLFPVGAAAAAADMQHIHQSSLISPLQRHPTAYTHHHSGIAAINYPRSICLYVKIMWITPFFCFLGDSERVKQLQFQLSSLNLTHISNPSENLYRDPVIGEREQLTSELQMIENTIQDREREIKVNQLRNVSKEVDDSSTASQGSLKLSTCWSLEPSWQAKANLLFFIGQMLEGYSSITTTAKLGQASSSGRNVVLDIS